jgi:hypothetical protein
VDRDRFLETAGRRGIHAEAAAALYGDLYGSAPERLSRTETPFLAETRLTRTVQVLVWVGTVAVIGAHAWWSTDGYESLGIGIVLVLTLVWQAGFLVAAEWARRREYALLVAGFAAIVVFYTPLTDAFPFLLMLGGIGFIGLAVWLARVDSPIRRWLAERGLPAPQRDVAF